MVQKISSTWSIVYNSFHTGKFALLCLKLCKETLFFAHPENVLLGMLGTMMKRLEDWQLI